jgi:hypothetical protein
MKYSLNDIFGKKFQHLEATVTGPNIEDVILPAGKVIPTIEELEAADLELQKEEYRELRRREYPSLDDMLVALIEKEEGRPEALSALMAERALVKTKYPKT